MPVFSCIAKTPLEEGEGTVTFRSPGIVDCSITVKYSDPALGHVAIFGSSIEETEELPV